MHTMNTILIRDLNRPWGTLGTTEKPKVNNWDNAIIIKVRAGEGWVHATRSTRSNKEILPRN